MAENRKTDHIDLSFKSQTSRDQVNHFYDYEPLFSAHPKENEIIKTSFLGKTLNYPIWISSMTGGAKKASTINKNLAKLCFEYKIGMGLGSTRSLLDSDEFFEDFNLRPIMGDDLPLFINLGIAQLESLVINNSYSKINNLIEKLRADGLIIHINPLQEWFQPEGDRYQQAPIETIKKLLENRNYKVIVKEVGQGMGPRSLEALIDMEVDAIETASFGGTNFSTLESLRRSDIHHEYSMNVLKNVGHTPLDMIHNLNKIYDSNKKASKVSVIISGGLQNVVEGQYYRELLKMNSIMGFGLRFLKHAENYNDLNKFLKNEIDTLLMSKAFLVAKKD